MPDSNNKFMSDIAGIRKEYTLESLDISTVLPNPVAQFERWFQEAVNAKVAEPNAMFLATVNETGRPSARIVLLKGIEDGQFIFYTNHQSRKGQQLENNAACALTFFWPDLERQVRIEGVASRVSSDAAERYFQSRPRASQVGAWSSPQSAVIGSRTILEQRVQEIEKRFEGKEALPKPAQWGGYQVQPYQMEFWQGRPSRLHDRIEYVLDGTQWKIHRLAP